MRSPNHSFYNPVFSPVVFAMLFFALAFFLSACEKKTALAIPAIPPVEGPLVMTAKLIDISGSFPANELYNYAYVMRYQVIKVVKGTYSEAEILVGHYNPRMTREEIKDEQDDKVGGNVKSFEVGAIHYLVMAPMEGTWTGAIEDDYFKDKHARYWALWADKLK